MEKIEFVRKMYMTKNSCMIYIPGAVSKGLRSDKNYRVTIEEVEGQN